MPTDLDLDAGDVPDGPTSLDDSRPPSGPSISRVDSAASGASSSLSTATAEPPKLVGAAAAAAAAAADDCGTCSNCLDKPRFGGRGFKRKGCTARAKVSRAVLPGTEVAPGMKRSPEKADAPAPKRTSGRTTSAPPPPPAEEPPPPPPPPPAEAEEPVRRPGPIEGDDDCGTCEFCLDKRKFGGPGIRRKSCVLKQKGRVSLGGADDATGAAAASSSVLPSRPPAPRRAAAPTYLGDGHRPVDESSPAKFNAALGDASPFVAGGVTPSALMLQTPELELLAGGISPLSAFANLMERTPRLPEETIAGNAEKSISPLLQLANIMSGMRSNNDAKAQAAAAAAAAARAGGGSATTAAGAIAAAASETPAARWARLSSRRRSRRRRRSPTRSRRRCSRSRRRRRSRASRRRSRSARSPASAPSRCTTRWRRRASSPRRS